MDQIAHVGDSSGGLHCLPLELLIEIVIQLSPLEVFVLRRVSKWWQAMLSSSVVEHAVSSRLLFASAAGPDGGPPSLARRLKRYLRILHNRPAAVKMIPQGHITWPTPPGGLPETSDKLSGHSKCSVLLKDGYSAYVTSCHDDPVTKSDVIWHDMMLHVHNHWKPNETIHAGQAQGYQVVDMAKVLREAFPQDQVLLRRHILTAEDFWLESSRARQDAAAMLAKHVRLSATKLSADAMAVGHGKLVLSLSLAVADLTALSYGNDASGRPGTQPLYSDKVRYIIVLSLPMLKVVVIHRLTPETCNRVTRTALFLPQQEGRRVGHLSQLLVNADTIVLLEWMDFPRGHRRDDAHAIVALPIHAKNSAEAQSVLLDPYSISSLAFLDSFGWIYCHPEVSRGQAPSPADSFWCFLASDLSRPMIRIHLPGYDNHPGAWREPERSWEIHTHFSIVEGGGWIHCFQYYDLYSDDMLQSLQRNFGDAGAVKRDILFRWRSSKATPIIRSTLQHAYIDELRSPDARHQDQVSRLPMYGYALYNNNSPLWSQHRTTDWEDPAVDLRYDVFDSVRTSTRVPLPLLPRMADMRRSHSHSEEDNSDDDHSDEGDSDEDYREFERKDDELTLMPILAHREANPLEHMAVTVRFGVQLCDARYEAKTGELLAGGDDSYLIYISERVCSKCGPKQAHVFVSWDEDLGDAALADWPGLKDGEHSTGTVVNVDCDPRCVSEAERWGF
ncbi:hypothetical protein BDZ91DRAFT_729049 [Kalaharituber pfeilii]|nr:hypothetical protein BDZ91DRAFT_729049 [Kalaharituber pfeilii]